MKVGHSIAVRNTIQCTTLITGQRLQRLAASWTFNWIQKRYICVHVLLAFNSATLLFPIPRLLRVTLFFLWSVVWFDAVTVRPWYMKVELFRSFWNFFISGALADGAYLEKRNKFYLNRVQKSQFYSLPSGQVAHVQCRQNVIAQKSFQVHTPKAQRKFLKSSEYSSSVIWILQKIH